MAHDEPVGQRLERQAEVVGRPTGADAHAEVFEHRVVQRDELVDVGEDALPGVVHQRLVVVRRGVQRVEHRHRVRSGR